MPSRPRLGDVRMGQAMPPEQLACGVAVLHINGRHRDHLAEALCVHRHLSLASVDQFRGTGALRPPAHRGGALARLRVHDQRYRTAHRLRPLRSRWRTWSRMRVPRRCGSSERKPVNRLPQCSVQSRLSSGVLVDYAEIEAFTVGHLVVAARREKHRADVCGLGKDAGLPSEREAVVDVVAAVD